MARPRKFDEAAVIQAARDQFWLHGFNGTSLDDLTDVTGLGRGSLYGAFTDKRTLFTKALHPYTEQLLLAVPVPDPRIKRPKRVLQGDVPSPINPPSGCHFHTRCPYAVERCRVETPALREVRPGQMVACHLR